MQTSIEVQLQHLPINPRYFFIFINGDADDVERRNNQESDTTSTNTNHIQLLLSDSKPFIDHQIFSFFFRWSSTSVIATFPRTILCGKPSLKAKMAVSFFFVFRICCLFLVLLYLLCFVQVILEFFIVGLDLVIQWLVWLCFVLSTECASTLIWVM